MILAWLKKLVLGNVLSSVFIGIIVVLFAIIIIPNLNQLSERFGFETRTSLKEKMVTVNKNLDTAKSANESLGASVIIAEKTTENTVASINNQIENKNKSTSAIENIIAKKKVNTEKIKKDPPTAVADIEPKLKVAMELSGESLERVKSSQINALSLWETYCEFNDDSECKAKPTGA